MSASVPESLLTPKEVSAVYRVDPRTVLRWAKAGRIKSVDTPGGRLKRFRASDVEALLAAPDEPQNEPEPVRCSRT